jgi:sulfide:quinone oxidoreductase
MSRKWLRTVRSSPTHDLPFGFSMILPAFRGVPAVYGIEGLTNPRGFILADKHQRNPTFKNVYSLGVCVAIPPIGPTPVPVGVPKTGFMIESMVTAIAANLKLELAGKEPRRKRPGTRSALPISAMAAWPLSPSRRSRRAISTGRRGQVGASGQDRVREILPPQDPERASEPFYEKLALHALGIRKLRFK